MPADQAISLIQALSEEFTALRPESGYTADSEGNLFRKVHAEEKPFAALCISGGGIRSATFALGALQGLAEQGLLAEFDYLSTVSGGGYIGSWLTSWKQREGGLEKVIPFLRRSAPPIPPGDPDPIQHLREYNSYLSPKLGLFSADTWTLAATMLRNMLLNWLVFVPLLAAALVVPRVILSIARLGETYDQFYGGALFIPPAMLAKLIPAVSAVLFAVAVFNMMRYLPGAGRANHSELDFLKWVLLPLVLAALIFVTNDSWFPAGGTTKPGAVSPQLIGYGQMEAGVMASAFAGWLAYLLFCGKSLKERLQLSLRVTPPVLLAGWIAGSVSWLLANDVYPDSSWPLYITVAAPLLLLAILFAGCIFVGVASRELKDEDREWLSRGGAWVLLYVVAWAVICTLVLLAPDWALGFPVWGKSALAGAGAIGGWTSALVGSSPKTSASRAPDGAPPTPLPLRIAMALAAPAFAIAFIVGLAIVTDWVLKISHLGASADPDTGKLSHCPGCAWWNHQAMLEGTRWESGLLLGLGFLLFAWLMAHFINTNKFSLHAMYRNRLIRAYLGASNPRRNASKFTGFAENDNLAMRELDTRLKPFHIVNITLNLVSGQRLAWQQRKAESFTVSPLHCGAADLGYRPSSNYGGVGGITLGTAVTISGAAASPNMGYHSSPVIGFIMTLFNARLGCWLGNPGPAGTENWREAGPTSAVGSLVKEAFGLTNNTNQWVYLSDGGHFENLGLYEMVRRRCRYILVLDGGCDPNFNYGDLGNALRKIRIDLKIPVEFDDRGFRPLRQKETRYAVARICYGVVDDTKKDGYVIYVKPMIRGNEPPDVASYRSDHRDFPHQSTSDQFFNESQTESYRALGAQTIAEICQGWDGEQGIFGLVAYLSASQKIAATAP
jgi:hypothetical protein